MKIVRSPRPERGYTVYDNRLLRDRRMSWLALGILVELLSHRDGWETDSTKLAASRPGVGRDAVRKALRELEALGYIERTKARGPDAAGRLVWTTRMVVRDVPRDGFPTDRDESGTISGDGQSGAGNSPESRNRPSGRPADTPEGDEPGTVSEDGFPGVGNPAVGNAVPSKKDHQKDQEEQAAASGDHHQSGVTDELRPAGRTQEPSPDAVKILDGCGVDPHARAWADAAEHALARGGTPLEIIDHVMAPVTGEPRSVEAIRLTRLRTWPGRPSPRTGDELYGELRAEYPLPAPKRPQPAESSPPPRPVPDDPPDEPTAPPMTDEERKAMVAEALRKARERRQARQQQPARTPPPRRDATDDDKADQRRQLEIFARYRQALDEGKTHEEAERYARATDDGQPSAPEGETPA